MWQSYPAPPLTGVNMALRSMTRDIPGASVSQRLKRADRIVQKLARFPHMRLTQMGDIGGCRVVLSSLDDLRRLEGKLRKTWKDSLNDVDDYITHPKSTGYRAVHLQVLRRGRLVEVQLRTRRQHRWATVVETHEIQSGQALKHGIGDPTTLDAFVLLGEAFAFQDEGKPFTPELLDRIVRNPVLSNPRTS